MGNKRMAHKERAREAYEWLGQDLEEQAQRISGFALAPHL
jgi:hypothetical protein